MTDQVSRLDVVATDNVSAAMNAAAGSLDKAAASADGVSVSVTRAGRSAESYVKQNDAVTKATTALAKAMADQAAQAKAFADAMNNGSASTEQFARAAEGAQSKVDAARANLNKIKNTSNDLGSSNGALKQSFRNLEIQFSQTASGIASGQPIFMTLMQQGHQVADEMIATGVSIKELGSYAGTMLAKLANPMVLAAAAAAGLTYAVYEMTKAGNDSLGMLASTQVSLRGTRSDFDDLGQTVVDVARRVSQTSGLGLTEALKTAQTLASAKYFSGTARDLEGLTRDAENLGVMMGGTAIAAKALADGMQDPSKEAASLSATFSRTLTPALLEQISLTQKAGDYNKAYSLLLGGLKSAAGDAARDGLSPMARAWKDLGEAFAGGTDGWRPFFEWMATTATSALNGITAAVRGVGAAFKDARDIASRGGFDAPVFDGTRPGSAPAGTTATPVNALPTTAASKDAFISQWTDAARQAGSALGVSPNVLLAQWGLESGWGKSAYNNNVGNMKPGAGYAGETFVNPGDNQTYRGYKDPAAFATDFVATIIQKWPDAKGSTSAAAYAAALHPGQKGGYAEDPNYAAKLTATADGMAAGSASSGAVSNQKALNDELAKTVEASRQYKDLQLSAEYDNIASKLAKEAAEHGTDTAAYAALTQAAEKNTAARTANADAMTIAQRQSDSAIRASKGLTAAEQEVSAAIEQRRQVAVAAGMAFTKADENQAVNNVLQQQSQAYARNVDDVKRAIDAQQTLTAAYDSGSGAVVAATVRQQAYAVTIQQYSRDSPLFARALDANVERYQKLASATNDTKTAQQNLQTRQQIEYLDTETASIGQNEAARTRDLAVMKATQEKVNEYGTTDLPLVARQYIALKAATADATSELAHQQATLGEVSGFFTNTFDTISNAITQAFATGQLQALKFGDVMKSVASAVLAEFAKLALLNPLKNLLFGDKSTTLGDVGGLIGNMFGGGGSSNAGGAKDASAVFGGAGGVIGAQIAASSEASATGIAGTLSSLFNNPTGAIASLGKSVLSLVSGGAATSAAESANAVFGGVGGVSGAASGAGGAVGGFAGFAGSVASTLGASNSVVATITSAASSVASALPYIGTAVSVITSIAKGDYRGAGLVAAGAAIGSIIPGIGTAIGAAVGGLVSMFLPNHPLHPFEDVELNVSGGRLAAGKSDGQLSDVAGLVAGTTKYADTINGYLDHMGIRIAMADGNIGRIGQGITGLSQTLDPNTLFGKLDFTNANPSDRSNFSVAKGALDGMKFDTPQALSDELAKIAGFADAASTLGIQLASVTKGITNIQIAGVTGGDANAQSTVASTDGRSVTYQGDMRTALNNDLPRQSYADVTALDAEIAKVGAFLSTTLPSLLLPTRSVPSTVQDQVQASNSRYADAMAQSQSYGLDNTPQLSAARDQAIAIIMQPALDSLNTTLASIAGRGQALLGGASGAAQATMNNLGQTQNNERAAVYDQIHQTFGDNAVATENYNRAMQSLLVTQDAEIAATRQQIDLNNKSAYSSLATSMADYAKRAGVEGVGVDLLAYDAKADAERAAFVKSFTDFYGPAVVANQDFQNQLLVVDKAHATERLAIEKQYTGQSQQLIADRNNAGQAITSLTKYAQGLQTGSNSALSTQDQYSLAGSQFNAVAGAARAGDYNSVQQVQSYADSFLTASRAINGSGAQYATDFRAVIDALGSISAMSPDTLTASYMASVAQQQTDQLVGELQALRAEVVALRVQTSQSSTAPARVAA